MLVVLLGATFGASLQLTAEGQPPPVAAAAQAPAPAPAAPSEPHRPSPGPAASRRAASASLRRFPPHQRPVKTAAVLERGKALYLGMCSACHGADARGGQLGVDLLRSPLVLGDRDGELVMPVVKNGRPGTAMMAIPLPDADITAVVAYVHSLQAKGEVQRSPAAHPSVLHAHRTLTNPPRPMSVGADAPAAAGESRHASATHE